MVVVGRRSCERPSVAEQVADVISPPLSLHITDAQHGMDAACGGCNG